MPHRDASRFTRTYLIFPREILDQVLDPNSPQSNPLECRRDNLSARVHIPYSWRRQWRCLEYSRLRYLFAVVLGCAATRQSDLGSRNARRTQAFRIAPAHDRSVAERSGRTAYSSSMRLPSGRGRVLSPGCELVAALRKAWLSAPVSGRRRQHIACSSRGQRSKTRHQPVGRTHGRDLLCGLRTYRRRLADGRYPPQLCPAGCRSARRGYRLDRSGQRLRSAW